MNNPDKNLPLATEALKEGDKALSTGLFKWKPDHELAARKYALAAKHFRLCGDDHVGAFVEASSKAADQYEHLEEYFSAAKALETAAKASPQPELFSRAAHNYRLNGTHDSAIACLMHAAEACGEDEADASVALYHQAVDVIVEEGRGRFSHDNFNKIVGVLLRRSSTAEALKMLERQQALYTELIEFFESYLHKNLLSQIVIIVHDGDYKLALAKMAEFDQVPRFVMSEESAAARALLDAVVSGDAEGVAEAKANSQLRFLHNAVSRMATRIEVDEAASLEAAKMMEAADEEEEPDWT